MRQDAGCVVTAIKVRRLTLCDSVALPELENVGLVLFDLVGVV